MLSDDDKDFLREMIREELDNLVVVLAKDREEAEGMREQLKALWESDDRLRRRNSNA